MDFHTGPMSERERDTQNKVTTQLRLFPKTLAFLFRALFSQSWHSQLKGLVHHLLPPRLQSSICTGRKWCNRLAPLEWSGQQKHDSSRAACEAQGSYPPRAPRGSLAPWQLPSSEWCHPRAVVLQRSEWGTLVCHDQECLGDFVTGRHWYCNIYNYR